MPDTPVEKKQTLNSNSHIYSSTYNGLGVEPAYPSGLKIEQQKTIQMIERHEHDAEAHAKRVLAVSKDGMPIDENNPLPVEASIDVGDIHIGAVEIKDKDSDIRATVIQRLTDTALIVQDLSEYQKNTVNIYGEATVPWDTEITLCTYTVPTSKTFNFSGIIIGGNADGEFFAKIGGTPIAKIRNTAAARTISAIFWNNPKVNAGGNVTITAKNISIRKNTREFEATLNGFILPAS